MTQRQRVLDLLERKGVEGVGTGTFLAEYLPSYPKRIFELRREGYEISSERLRASSWRYTLLAKPGALSVEEEELFDRTIPA